MIASTIRPLLLKITTTALFIFTLQQAIMATNVAAASPLPSGLVTTSSGTHICLSVDHSKCLVDHGVDNKITIQQSNYTNWFVGATTITGTTYYFFEDSQSHCLKAYGSGEVTVGSAICSTSTPNDLWKLSSSSPESIYNDGQKAYMGTFGDSDSTQVYVAQPASGFYWHWIIT